MRDGVRGDVFPAVEVGAEELYSVRRHRVGAGHGALDAVDGNAAGLQVQVGKLEHTDFGRSEAVAVGDGEYSAVAFGFDGREKALDFLLGEEGFAGWF